MKFQIVSIFVISTLFCACGGSGGPGASTDRSELSNLGEKIFHDTSLSNPAGQACSSCHTQATGFSDPNHAVVSPGATHGTSGSRNTPSIGYSLYSPEFGFSEEEGDYVGGLFWDGAARNFEEQARRPLFAVNEMNVSDVHDLATKIRNAPYANEFRSVFGDQIFSDPEQTFSAATSALSAYENTDEFRPFSSKYDRYVAKQVKLTESELRGLDIFTKPNKGNCAACHLITSPEGDEGRCGVHRFHL